MCASSSSLNSATDSDNPFGLFANPVAVVDAKAGDADNLLVAVAVGGSDDCLALLLFHIKLEISEKITEFAETFHPERPEPVGGLPSAAGKGQVDFVGVYIKDAAVG